MENLIGKKTAKQIKAGDVVGVTQAGKYGYRNAYFLFNGTMSVRNDHSIVTVISVCKVQCYNTDGQKCGFRYEMICSDGNTYNIGSGSERFFIFSKESAQ
jgi:hypothetical protein